VTGVDELAAWLRAQLDDDEVEAREALRRKTTQRRMIQGRMVDVENQPMPEWRRSVWPPERVLAEVEAKRRMLDLHQSTAGQHPDFCGHDMHELPCPTVRLLALPYAGHEGYREEWRPS